MGHISSLLIIWSIDMKTSHFLHFLALWKNYSVNTSMILKADKDKAGLVLMILQFLVGPVACASFKGVVRMRP